MAQKVDNKVIKSLSRFGLTEPEIQIYTAVLSLDKPTVREIAKKTGQQRTVIYFHIEDLIKKGVVREVQKGKVKRFSPVAPKELAERFQKWTTDFTSLVPALDAMRQIEEETPVVTLHDFKTSHSGHYNELASMPEGSEFRVIQSKKSADPDFQAFAPGEWKDIVQRFVDRKIMTRAIFTDEMIDTAHEQMDKNTYEIFKQRNWQLRSIKEERFGFEEMMIHQDKVSFFLTDISLMLQIKHKRIARAMISMFDALWLTGQPRSFK